MREPLQQAVGSPIPRPYVHQALLLQAPRADGHAVERKPKPQSKAASYGISGHFTAFPCPNLQERRAQGGPGAASRAAEVCVDYSRSAAQNAADMAAAAKQGATRVAHKAQTYVDTAAEQARPALGRAAEAGQSAAQQVCCFHLPIILWHRQS